MVLKPGDRMNYPENWERHKREIHRLMVSGDPNYKQRQYISPELYLHDVIKNPVKYPILQLLPKSTLKRYMGYFLIDTQKRVARGTARGQKAKRTVWMLPIPCPLCKETKGWYHCGGISVVNGEIIQQCRKLHPEYTCKIKGG